MWLTLILSQLKSNWKPLAILMILTIWSYYWYDLGREEVKAAWEAEKVADSLAAIEAERSNIKTSFEIGSGYETTKDGIDLSFNGYINSLSDTADIAAKANTTSKSNEAAGCNGLPKENKRKLLSLAREAELNTQQLIALQKWVREVK